MHKPLHALLRALLLCCHCLPPPPYASSNAHKHGARINSRLRTQLNDISHLGGTRPPIASSLSHSATAKYSGTGPF
jgi:hypothetical protein